MCGLSGMFVNSSKVNAILQKKLDKATQLLFHINTLRGIDASGVYASAFNINKNELVYTHETTIGTPENLPVTELWDRAYWNLIMTHNRSATIGFSDDINAAHPIIVGDVEGERGVLTHNGTLDFSYTEAKDYASDSALLAYNIYNNGIVKTLKEVYGAYTIIYKEEKESDILWLARNSERPLSIANIYRETYSKELKKSVKEPIGIMWSSVYDDLNWILNKLDINYLIGEMRANSLFAYNVTDNKLLNMGDLPDNTMDYKWEGYYNDYNIQYIDKNGKFTTSLPNYTSYADMDEKILNKVGMSLKTTVVGKVLDIENYNSYTTSNSDILYPKIQQVDKVIKIRNVENDCNTEVIQEGDIFVGDIAFITSGNSHINIYLKHVIIIEEEDVKWSSYKKIAKAYKKTRKNYNNTVLSHKKAEVYPSECSWCNLPLTNDPNNITDLVVQINSPPHLCGSIVHECCLDNIQYDLLSNEGFSYEYI